MRNQLKQLFMSVVFLSVLFAGPLLTLADTDVFSDVQGQMGQDIMEAYQLQLVNGYPDGTYRPNEEVTTAQFSTILSRVFAEHEVDVSLDSGDATPLTREEAAYYMNLGLRLDKQAEHFSDVPDSSPYAGDIGAVQQTGIINGYSESRFGYGDTLTRAQAAVFALRLYHYLDPFELEETTIAAIQAAMDRGLLTAEELVGMYLERIDLYDQQGPAINSIIAINPEAEAIARELDQERAASGPRSPLHGIPVVVKDNFDTVDMATTAGCLCLKDSFPLDDAEQIRLLKEAGAIIIAKANLHEFAFGITTVSSLGGQTLNPYNLEYLPGGSSGGTGAALAANFAVAGLGTDTGGSIRIPAAFNSLVGIRPTIGLTSRDGIIPLALTQDVGGPLARTVADAAHMLDATAGYDEKDVVTAWSKGQIPASYTDYLDVDGLQGARIGVARELFSDAAESQEVNRLVEQAVRDMERLGAEMIDITLPNLEEISQYPSLSSWEFKFQLNDYLAELGPAAKHQSLTDIIESGEIEQSMRDSLIARNERESLDEEEYKDIVLFRTRITQESIMKAMADHDLDAIVYPTTTHPAALVGQNQTSGTNNRLSAFSGFPAISLPAGYTSAGTPVGVELLAGRFEEPLLIKLGYSYEQGTQHRKAPEILQ
ncbi:amidase family protein [Alkalihalobacillus oceani]|uniref:amidase family protein n=1 Tax=Halalkalibacter oceani TaxID=1653776 RepID=UPI00203ED946|nr:amidase family protein [Halalkalibacter oceani]MCM3760985.1 amidase family protein [Halalkalibacter oceani]